MGIKILLLGGAESYEKAKNTLKSDEIKIVGAVTNEMNALDEISRTNPDIILITDTSSMSLRSCQQIYLLRPKSIPIVMCDEVSTNTMQKLMQSGIHYMLSWIMDTIQIVDEIKNIYINESNRMRVLENPSTSVNKSRVIMVFGTKGGVGKSSIACNLAVKLAQKNRKVVVLDYDFQFGDIASLFGINKKATILELIQDQENPNADIIRQFLTIHDSGVNVLLSPNSPEYADTITASQTEKIVSALRVHYDYVIVDCASYFNDVTISCIDCASEILFVTGLEISALKNSKKALDVLSKITREDKIKLVIGKRYKSGITEQDVSRVLQHQVWCAVPYDFNASVTAGNQGMPVVLDSPKSKVTSAISWMANDIDKDVTMNVGDNTPKKRRMFARK